MSEPSVARPRPRPSGSAAETRSARRTAERRRRRLRRRRILAAGSLSLLVVIGVTLAVVSASTDGSPRRHNSSSTVPGSGARFAAPDEVRSFLAGAASDIAAVTSYDYRSLADALNAGLDVTTGAYRKAYRAALDGDLGAQARAHRVVQTFDILRLGIGAMSTDGTSAKVLVFGQENVTDDTTGTNPRPQLITLTATVQRRGDRYLISELDEDTNAGLPPGTAELPVAAEAARSEILNLTTYSSAHFDADIRRSLADAVDPLRTQIIDSRAATQASVAGGDIVGTVIAVAVERADVTSVTMLVAARSARVTTAGTSTNVTDGRYEVVVVKVGGRWYASSATLIEAT